MALQNSQIIPLQFPMYGIDEGWAYGAQPQGTAPTAQNVRAYDALKQRLRGGSRPGTGKWDTDLVNGAGDDIRDLNKLVATPVEFEGSALILPIGQTQGTEQVETITLSTGTQVDFHTFTGTTGINGMVRDYNGNIYACGEKDENNYNVWKLDTDLDVVWEIALESASTFTEIAYDPVTHRIAVVGLRQNNLSLWLLDADTGATLNSVDTIGFGTSVYGVAFDSKGNIYVAQPTYTASDWKGLIKYDLNLTELWSWWCKWDASGSDTTAMKTVHVDADDNVIVGGEEADIWDDTEGGQSTDTKNIWSFDSDGNLLWSYLTDAGGGAHNTNNVETLFTNSDETNKVYVGKMGGTDDEQVVKIDISSVAAITEDWTYQTSTVGSTEAVYAIDIDSDGNIIVGGDDSTTWAGAGGSANIWRLNADDGSLHSNDNWPVDTGADRVNNLAATVTQATGINSTFRASILTVISNTDIFSIRGGSVITPTGGTAALSETGSNLPFSQPAFGKMFFIDGKNEVYYTPYEDTDDDTVSLWVPTAGTMPINPQLMALYRGRIVLSGVTSDPHNWFMSKVGNPFDFDYFPSTPTVIQAIAGNNSEVGLIGDIVTALMPYSDDLMLFGCDHSIWVLSGDPAAGGSLDRLSDKTGVVWGKAWTTGPKGEMYFLGTDGIYKMVPGKSLENITDKRFAKKIDDIDKDANYVMLEWDYEQRGLYVLIVDKGWSISSAQTVYFWEERTGAWWEDVYPTAMGPLCLHAYDADDPDDKALLMGGSDGYIHQIDFSKGHDIAADNSETDIAAFVEYSPIILDDNIHNTKLTEINATLAESSGTVDLLIKSAESNERLIENASTKIKKPLTAGRNKIKQRIAANCIGIELNKTGSNRWAIDSMKAVISSQGRVRRTRSS